jgi:hypothetical protein
MGSLLNEILDYFSKGKEALKMMIIIRLIIKIMPTMIIILMMLITIEKTIKMMINTIN